jgi:hypothetical protein
LLVGLLVLVVAGVYGASTALRTGQRPDGTVINPFMPWRFTRLMTDEEIQAVWAYLRTL